MLEQIFVAGPPRCGTSIMVRICRFVHPNLKSYDEGHVLDMIPHVNSCVDYFFEKIKNSYVNIPNMAIGKLSKDDLKNRLTRGVIESFVEIQGSEHFIDKTHGASMIWTLPYMKMAFTKGVSIVMIRRHIEYMRSAMVKFKLSDTDDNITFDFNLNQWIKCMNAWLSVKDQLGEFCIDIEHLDLAFNVEKIAPRLCDHLRVSDKKKGDIINFVKTNCIEKTKGSTYDPINLDELNLTDAQKQVFFEKTEEISKKLGYSYDKNYFI